MRHIFPIIDGNMMCGDEIITNLSDASYDCVKTINEHIIEQDGYGDKFYQVLAGSYTYNILILSMQIIKENEGHDVAKHVFNTFHLECFLTFKTIQ